MPTPKNLLEIMACPKCKGEIIEEGMFITCAKCKLAYPVLDNDIPDMLIEDAWPIENAKKEGFRHDVKI